MKAMRLIQTVSGFVMGFCLVFAAAGVSFAQTSASNTIPVVTVAATAPFATGPDNPGIFTVFRTGNTNEALNVWYELDGSASNGVDYAMIPPHLVAMPAGATSNTIVIWPLTNSISDVTKTVILALTNSPLLTPVNYEIGSPSAAVVYLLASNAPAPFAITSPQSGAFFYTPGNIFVTATLGYSLSFPTNVEFFAGTNDLGRGILAPVANPVLNWTTSFICVWTNPPAGNYALTAVAGFSDESPLTTPPVDITVSGAFTNVPPVVRITSPPDGAVFRQPVNLPLFAYAAECGGSVTSVDFFADGTSLGLGQRVTPVPPVLPQGTVQPPIIIFEPTNYWELTWSNAPAGTNIALTALATDSSGVSALSQPVSVSILPPLPPPTNRPPVVAIVATDPVAIAGTNCWPWPGLLNAAPAWSNWVAPGAVVRWITNCGPKNATFTVLRWGATNDDLDVSYAIGGTASNGVDYVMLPGTVVIPAGIGTATISIVPIDADARDMIRTVVLSLMGGTNYVVGRPAEAAAVIWDSLAPRATTGLVPGNYFQLSSAGPNGAWFHVDYSIDLLNWTPICTNQVIDGQVEFVDPEAASGPQRFYRAVPMMGGP